MYLEDFSSFLAVKVSRAAVWGQNEICTVFLCRTLCERGSTLYNFISLVAFRCLNWKLTVQIRQDKTLLIFALAMFQVPLWLSLGFIKVWLLLRVFSLYMVHFRYFNPASLLPGQPRNSSARSWQWGGVGVGLGFDVPRSRSSNLTLFRHLIFLGKSGLFFIFLLVQLAAVLTPSSFNHLSSNFFYHMVISNYKKEEKLSLFFFCLYFFSLI